MLKTRRLSLMAAIVFCGLAQAAQNADKIQQADRFYQDYRKTENGDSLGRARGMLDDMANSDPNNYQVSWRRARVYWSLGDDSKSTAEKLKLFQQAIDSAKHAVDLKPDGVEGHYWLGVSDGEYGDTKGMFKAMSMVGPIRKEMESVIRLDPGYQDAGGYLVLGRMDYELPGFMGGSKRRAIQEYEQGLKVAPSNPEMKVYLAESYIDAGRKDEARSLLDQVLSSPGESTPEWRDAKKDAKRLYDKSFPK